MKLGVVLGIIVGLAGCGNVELMQVADGGEADSLGGSIGTAGTTGMGMAGTGGTGGSAVECKPDACNDCVAGVRRAKADGALCGPGLCDDVLPFDGQDGCVSQNQICQAGACVVKISNCCRDVACPTGKAARCTAFRANDPTIPSSCTACTFPPKP